MERIVLINLPFASVNLPAFALAQLHSVVSSAHAGRVEVEVLYLNQELVPYVGLELNQYIVEALEANNTGVGDWLFRKAAFPDAPDTATEYLQRYYPYNEASATRHKRAILEARDRVDVFLDDAIERHRLHEASLVGLTSMFSQNMACFALARKLKQRNPRVVTVMGGANCETPMGEQIAQHVPSVDYVFSGPALKSFPELVGYHLDGDVAAMKAIRGVFTRGDIRPGEIGEELPIDVPVPLYYEPFFEAIDRNFPDGSVRPRLNFETSRGCWWGARAHCTFCGLNGSTMTYRTMPPAQALDQFQSLFSRYGGRVRRFESVDNILPQNYVDEVFAKMEPTPDVTLFYEVKASLNASDLAVLSNAGVKELQPGIESLATSTLKLMRKGTTAFTNLLFLKNCLLTGTYPFWNLLIGFPGEKVEVYQDYVRNFPLLVHLSPPDGVNPVRFDRFSPYFREAKNYGLDLHPYDYYGMIYPFPESTLHDLAYYFMDHNIDAEYFLTMARWIDPIRQQVDRWRARWVGKPHADVPKLYLTADGVLDTRTERRVLVPLDQDARRVLATLDQPQRASSVKAAHPDLDVDRQLDLLRGHGLLFEEDGKLLSLVLSDEPKPISGRTLYGLEI